MMGTSVLAIPWAIQQAGFALGIFVIVAMMCITLYTCLLVVRYGEGGVCKSCALEQRIDRVRVASVA